MVLDCTRAGTSRFSFGDSHNLGHQVRQYVGDDHVTSVLLLGYELSQPDDVLRTNRDHGLRPRWPSALLRLALHIFNFLGLGVWSVGLVGVAQSATYQIARGVLIYTCFFVLGVVSVADCNGAGMIAVVAAKCLLALLEWRHMPSVHVYVSVASAYLSPSAVAGYVTCFLDTVSATRVRVSLSLSTYAVLAEADVGFYAAVIVPVTVST